MAPLLPGNLGAKFSEMSFPKYKTYFTFTQLAVVTFSQEIKTTDFNSVFNVLFPKCMAHKKKSFVYLSKSNYIHLFSCGMLYSETCIKRTPSIKQTVAEVPKFISLIYFK